MTLDFLYKTAFKLTTNEARFWFICVKMRTNVAVDSQQTRRQSCWNFSEFPQLTLIYTNMKSVPCRIGRHIWLNQSQLRVAPVNTVIVRWLSLWRSLAQFQGDCFGKRLNLVRMFRYCQEKLLSSKKLCLKNAQSSFWHKHTMKSIGWMCKPVPIIETNLHSSSVPAKRHQQLIKI